MKITKGQLKKLIKEELQLLTESTKIVDNGTDFGKFLSSKNKIWSYGSKYYPNRAATTMLAKNEVKAGKILNFKVGATDGIEMDGGSWQKLSDGKIKIVLK